MNTVQDKLEQIKADIASEKLTYPQIRERLETLIEHEYSKEGGPDVDLVIACEDLLWRLRTDNAPFVTHKDQYKEAMRSRIEASQRTRQIKKPVLRFVAALVVVVLLLEGAEMFRHREWLEQTDTEDQQQHIVQGYVVDPDLVAKAIAGENEATTLSTTNYQEVRNYLGFDLPQALFINDWQPELYFIDIQPIYIKVVIMYSHKDDKQSQLMLDARLFTDVEDAYVPYEQEQNGTIEMVGGNSVYFSNNYLFVVSTQIAPIMLYPSAGFSFIEATGHTIVALNSLLLFGGIRYSPALSFPLFSLALLKTSRSAHVKIWGFVLS